MAQDNEIDRQYAGTHFSAAAPAEGFEVLLITGMSGAGGPMRPTAWRIWAGTWSTTCLRNCWCHWST